MPMYTILVLSLLIANPPTFEVRPLAGDAVSGTVVELTAERVSVETTDGRVSWPLDQIAAMTPSRRRSGETAEPMVWVELVDGSKVGGLDYSAQGGRARIDLPGAKTLEMASRNISSVRLQAETESIAEEWSRIMEEAPSSDVLVVRKDDSIDYHEGLLRDVTDSIVEFELGGEVLLVRRNRLQGLIYHQTAGRRLPEPICRLAEADGSEWAASSIALKGDQLVWKTPLGLEIARPWDAVAAIDFSAGKILYLSDLEPESAEWMPYFGSNADVPALAQFYAPREDQNLESGPLTVDGQRYAKGLALHSRTTLVYRLPARFRRLKAVAGIDDAVRPQGNARLVISGDGHVLLEAILSGTGPPKPIDVDLTGVRRLRILVDFGDDLDVGDHVDLCDARIVK